MKKIIGLLAVVLCLTTSLTACMDDSKAEATCVYYVMADSVSYSDPQDIVYDTLVQKSLATLGHCFYTFSESAKVKESLQVYAVNECDRLADLQFKTNLGKSVTLSDLKNEMYKANSNDFASKGITHAEAIPLHSLTLHVSLWNYTLGTQLDAGTIRVTQ